MNGEGYGMKRSITYDEYLIFIGYMINRLEDTLLHLRNKNIHMAIAKINADLAALKIMVEDK